MPTSLPLSRPHDVAGHVVDVHPLTPLEIIGAEVIPAVAGL
jgi:hypothetical protein